MKTALFLIFVLCVGVVAHAEQPIDSEFALPTNYRRVIRDYVAKKEKTQNPAYARFIITFYTPGIVNVLRREPAIPSGKQLRAVRIDWTPKKWGGPVYLMVVQEVIVFHDSKIIGAVSVDDVEWLDGKPTKEE